MQSLRQFDNPKFKAEEIYFKFNEPYWQDWLKSEGFEHIVGKTEDSYTYQETCPETENIPYYNQDYWYWVKCFNGWLFRIYVFRNCIICEKEFECGGFAGSRSFTIDIPINEIWDDIIEYIKFNIQ